MLLEFTGTMIKQNLNNWCRYWEIFLVSIKKLIKLIQSEFRKYADNPHNMYVLVT